ncbi:restriction endonuclease [Tractidigestivibacter scatoligenes]|uniref:site-specific DNA-methyltransferase (adenine-specific) n=1 Tax=Tractidigestivibacter scatoligenes TaxID=1299998 RepID=A0A100YU76_TRASO|nr:Eco57I restriction-modification methylase domain-containing protein [Tractidigestivibacter scatoligenes]KUH57775.1 restriction endonuclease [Tractidigestivibacter scatoligenes]
MSSLFESTYNPDVLSCLANLSNDEVFTPPELANQMLDLLPEDIWHDPNATFLDPACKSGVFLREIAKRLIEGLADEYPDLQERLDHIYKRQIFGIAITELTSLLSRRSLYCSKYPNSKYSVVRFDGPEGNIRFKNVQHTWRDGRCVWCGAAQQQYDRDPSLEQYAYEFIHIDNPEEVLHMKFDVIIGNPPYQLSDGGNNASAMPIYQKFVEQAKKLNPRFLVMITPSRWFSGGRGLDSYRKDMLNDRHIRKLVDYEDANECFPGVDMSGGVSYFLWERDYKGDCAVINMKNGEADEQERDLGRYDILIRSNQAVSIVDKVTAHTSKFLSAYVSSQKPFGLRTFAQPTGRGDLTLRWRNGRGPIERTAITAGQEWIDKWKVIVSRVVYEHAGGTDAQGMRRVLSILEVLGPKEVCTETYIVVKTFDTEAEARNCMAYLALKFPRFLISQVASAQMVNKKSFMFVPDLDFSRSWTDVDLYNEFSLDDQETAYIENHIKEMNPGED